MTQKSFRTPLGRVRWLGAAHLGAEDSWRMRATSAALVPLTIGFVWVMLSIIHKDYNAARAILSEPLPAVVTLLFVGFGITHMELGMRSIIVDYIPGAAREWALLGNSFIAILLGVACVYAILRIGFV